MLTIQFGQCGNQLGHNLYSKVTTDLESSNTGVRYDVNHEYMENTIEKWFDGVEEDGRRFARGILVDTEEKVLDKICKDMTASWFYRPSNIVYQYSDCGGSANNWAYGYCINSERLLNTVSNITQRQIERLDHFQGFLLLLSSAGGTGSGIGSRMVEYLRDEYKTKPIVATIILPFTFGEVCTQNYNTILTIAKFCDKADFSLLFENEQIHAVCTNLLSKSNATLHDMNSIITEKLLAVFQPISDTRYNMNFLISNIAPHINFRLATIESAPYIPATSLQYEPIHKWDVYLHHLKYTLRIPKSQVEATGVRVMKAIPTSSKTAPYVYCRCVSNVLVTRGKSTENDIMRTEELQKRDIYSDWITSQPFVHLHQERRILNQNKFLALVTNNTKIHQPLDVYLNKAWNSYKCAAFLHQYKQFGWEDDDFLRAFAKVENIAQEYRSLKSLS